MAPPVPYSMTVAALGAGAASAWPLITTRIFRGVLGRLLLGR
jgi:hypothetical protein